MADFNDRGFEKSHRIGREGELFYADLCKTKGLSTIDVTEDPFFQLIDIDMIVAKDKDTQLTNEYVENLKNNILAHKEDYKSKSILIDVKTDTDIKRTNNVFLEFLAHNKPGCFSITKADKWIYLDWDENNKKAIRMWSIDIEKVRNSIVKGDVKIGFNGVAECRKEYDGSGKEVGIYAWIVPIEHLKKIGCADNKNF